MKPLHIGLLAVGATLAGGLAFKMTQPPAIPMAGAPAPVVLQNAGTTPAPLPAPGVIAAKPVKPSPIPKPSHPPVAEAPAPIYAQEPKPVTRQSRPMVMARASTPKAAPTQWAPLPYQTPATPKSGVSAVPAPTPGLTAGSAEPATSPSPEPRHVTLRTGMTVAVRLEESLSTDRATAGDTFQAVLAEPLVVDNLVIAERGARATGSIIESQKGARLGNTSFLELALTSILTSDGQRVSLATDPWVKQTERADDPIGAIFSRPKPANVPAASVIPFRLSSRVTVTEQVASR